ncbi:MAG: hypothetical protein WBG88_06930 [Mesorhizobium sp.]
MPEKSDYETGARKYPARTGPDPNDDFSPDAAMNRPPKGGGLSDKTGAQGKRHPKEDSPEPDHVDPSPRDTREAPAPNPNGQPIKNP